jgi:hypothetical protein
MQQPPERKLYTVQRDAEIYTIFRSAGDEVHFTEAEAGFYVGSGALKAGRVKPQAKTKAKPKTAAKDNG